MPVADSETACVVRAGNVANHRQWIAKRITLGNDNNVLNDVSWADICRNQRCSRLCVFYCLNRKIDVELVVKRTLFQLQQKLCRPTPTRAKIVASDSITVKARGNPMVGCRVRSLFTVDLSSSQTRLA